MPSSPNVLFLMMDQLRGDVLNPDSPCHTPTLDKLVKRGVRITRAYTTSATCSPARASLMTGLLPHTHGVLQVTHCQPRGKCEIDASRPHWAQRLQAAGYRTGYFGKWHVEPDEDPTKFGWEYDASGKSAKLRDYGKAQNAGLPAPTVHKLGLFNPVPGYPPYKLWGVDDRPTEKRGCGIVTSCALDWLDGVIGGDNPWCCFVSVHEPHDPFIAGKEAFDRYDPASLPIPDNWHDDQADRPASYRKSASVFASLTEADRREIAACYYAMVTQADEQFARLIDRIERAGELDNTIVVLTSDHGELLGAHGMYCKNVGGYEEIYNIPMVLSGPGIPAKGDIDARVGLHDLGSTIIDLVGLGNFQTDESKSFAPLAQGKEAPDSSQYATGYAEYFGTRFWWTQRIHWDGPWKLVWNGIEPDELYNLEEDPQEMRNRIDDPSCAERAQTMMRSIWQIIERTDDHPLGRAVYPPLRTAPCGPLEPESEA